LRALAEAMGRTAHMALATLAALAALAPGPLWAADNPRLTLPEFAQLADKASNSVTITLDAALLGMASKFLDGNDSEDAAVKEAIKGLQGIYIRSYTFDEDFVYRPSDIDAVVKQLSAPGWTRLVQTRSRKTHANVDIYIMLVDNKATGLALIASEPREFTIVNIIGSIDLDKLHKLEGHFGVPNLELPKARP
jgi:hypothetical protein